MERLQRPQKIEKTKDEIKLKQFINNFKYLFKDGCETSENSYEDIVLDLLEFAFDESDGID